MKNAPKKASLFVLPSLLLLSCGTTTSAPDFYDPKYQSQECSDGTVSYTVYYLDVSIMASDDKSFTCKPSDFTATNPSSEKVAATHFLRSSLPFNVSGATGLATTYTPNYETSYTIPVETMYPAHIVFDFQISAASVLYYKGAQVVYTVL